MSIYNQILDTTTIVDGFHDIYAIIKDITGNYQNTSTISVRVDNSPPIISTDINNAVLLPGTNSFQIVCRTSENAVCKYSSTPNVSFVNMSNTFSSTGGTLHSTTITGLMSGLSYIYYIKSIDQFGNFNSDDYIISFSVASTVPEPIKNITISSPNGGENLKIGRTKKFYWTSSGISGDIKIELSRDGGATYQLIFISDNSGSASWVVTPPRSNTCKIKLSSVNDPSIFDTSEGIFKIT